MKGIGKHISWLKNTIEKNNLFFQNLTYLSILEIFNVLVPIITLPYLLRTLGKEMYGLVIFAQAIIYYLAVFQNFGLNTFAVKEASIHRDNSSKMSSLFSNVLIFKTILFICSLAIVFLLVSISSELRELSDLLFLTMWLCLYDLLFPKWYFQGIEKMKYITYLNGASKVIIVILIFTLIRSEKDFLLLPIIYGIGALIAGIGALIVVFNRHKIRFKPPGFKELQKLAKNTSAFFISDISISIFANSNKVIIGSFLGMAEVAYYDLADKIVSLFKKIPLNVVRDAIYPRVAKTRDIGIIHKISAIMGSYSIIVIIGLAFLAPLIVTLFGGSEMLESADVLRLFSISIFTTHISNYYITVGLWSLGYEKSFRNLMILATLIFLLLFGVLYLFDLINLYSLTLLPIIVDIYLIFHTYSIYKRKELI